MRLDLIPRSWHEVLAPELEKPYFRQLQQFVAAERAEHEVYPPEDDVFNALRYTPFDQVKAFLLGQDPYHGAGQAHGLCFSVQPGVDVPPSLVNMYRELEEDVDFRRPNHGYLTKWAEQGLLMLNAVLTVRAGEPNSHKGRGWEKFTDAAIAAVNSRTDHPVVFLLWGGYAKKKLELIDQDRHAVITSAHPSPLSARSGFFGSRCFSRTNEALRSFGLEPIDWQLDDL